MIPLYFRLESLLRNKILSGQLEPGQKLPTEEDLISKFSVSRTTVRNAVSHLESEGLIIKLRSKGTFVSEKIAIKKQVIYTGDVKDIVLNAKKFDTKPLGIQKLKIGNTRIARTLRQFFTFSNEDEVVRVQRVRKQNDIPIYYLENFMPPGFAEYFTEEELSNKPLLEILKDKIDLVIDRGQMVIEAMPAEPDVADILGCIFCDAIASIQISYWFPSDIPFEVVTCFIRGDYFKYTVDLDPKGL